MTATMAAARGKEGKVRGKVDGKACCPGWENQTHARETAILEGGGIAMVGTSRHGLKHRTTKAVIAGNRHGLKHPKTKIARLATITGSAQNITKDAHEAQIHDRDRQNTTTTDTATANESQIAPEVQPPKVGITTENDVQDLPKIAATIATQNIHQPPNPKPQTQPQTQKTPTL